MEMECSHSCFRCRWYHYKVNHLWFSIMFINFDFLSQVQDLFLFLIFLTLVFLYVCRRSDVLGQFMPLVGIDWSQTGVTHLFSAVKVCYLCFTCSYIYK